MEKKNFFKSSPALGTARYANNFGSHGSLSKTGQWDTLDSYRQRRVGPDGPASKGWESDIMKPLEPMQPFNSKRQTDDSQGQKMSSLDIKSYVGKPTIRPPLRGNLSKDPPNRWSGTGLSGPASSGFSEQPLRLRNNTSEQIPKYPSADWTTNGEVSSPMGAMVASGSNSAAATTMAAASAASSATINRSQMFSSNEVVSSSSSSSSSTSTTAASSKMVQQHAKIEQQQQQESSSSSSLIENKNFVRSISGLRRESLVDSNGGTVVSPISEEALASAGEVTFEQKQHLAASKTSLKTGEFMAETVNATNQGMTRVQVGDVSYQEKMAMAARKEKMATESYSTEQVTAVHKEQKQLKTSEMTQQGTRTTAAQITRATASGDFSEKRSVATQESGMINSHQKHEQTHMASKMMFSTSSSSSKGLTTSAAVGAIQSTQQINAAEIAAMSREIQERLGVTGLNELDKLCEDSPASEVQKTIEWSCTLVGDCCRTLIEAPDNEASAMLKSMDTFLRRAWTVPTHGYALGNSLCNVLRDKGGLDFLVRKSSVIGEELSFRCACVLEQCLTTENRVHIAENGLDKVVVLASNCSLHADIQQVRVGTGILENLFKHNERTCKTVIRKGGLGAILKDCQRDDVETLRHCASALANLALYGGPDNQQTMVKGNGLMWLFPLAFNNDDTIKYFACLAVAALVANKEIEATVSQSDVLGLVEPFVSSHDPADFASRTVDYVHGQSKSWLSRLVPVLMSSTEPAKSLAAFHFAMEAGIKKKQGATEMFNEINAIEPLKAVASSPNAIASRYAVQALQLIGEQLPHKLSQQVPLWTVEDVTEWLKQIGFANYTDKFVSSRVDGDLLLQLTEPMMQADIGMTNGILRKRFTRELGNLKKMADYEACNASALNAFLKGIDVEFTQYTYGLLKAGVDQSVLGLLTDEQLARDCCVESSIHRLRIIQATRGKLGSDGLEEDSSKVNKNLDVFISYRRSNGSQLASLLKVHLQLKGFSVFIDVERLEAGKFDNNLLQSVRKAKHFLLVLTPNALERCLKDVDCKDWVHREIVAALQSQCNIIPIFDNFQWPEVEMLPEDMRSVHFFNGVTWIHDYQDACVDKLERFLRGEVNSRLENLPRYPGTHGNFANRPGGYQRSQSNESKSSHNSDKDTKENGAIC